MPRVVARVNNPNNEWMFNEMWGVDVSVSTPHLLTAVVEEAVNVGSFVRLLSLEGGNARLAEVTLTDELTGDRRRDRRTRSTPRIDGRRSHPRPPRGRAARRHRACAPTTRCSCSSPATPRTTSGECWWADDGASAPPRSNVDRRHCDRPVDRSHRRRARSSQGQGVRSGHPHAGPPHDRVAGARGVDLRRLRDGRRGVDRPPRDRWHRARPPPRHRRRRRPPRRSTRVHEPRVHVALASIGLESIGLDDELAPMPLRLREGHPHQRLRRVEEHHHE